MPGLSPPLSGCGALRNRRYGCVSTYAKDLGEDQAVLLLRQTLEEEKETGQEADSTGGQINIEAASSEESDAGSKSGKSREDKAGRA